MDSKYKMTLTLSEEQMEAMEAIIQQMQWDNVITGVEKLTETTKQCDVLSTNGTAVPSAVTNVSTNACARDRSPLRPGPHDDRDEVNERCPYCFISPCIVASNRTAHWIGHGHPPSENNPSIRRAIYRRFWKIVDNVGGWRIQDYILKKMNIGGGEWVVQHQREIMPECVVSLSRNLYPNLPDQAYMGHKWN